MAVGTRLECEAEAGLLQRQTWERAAWGKAGKQNTGPRFLA